MKLEDLKFGDIVTTRNKMKWVVIEDRLLSVGHSQVHTEYYNTDLTSKHSDELDIMKVERYIPAKPIFSFNSTSITFYGNDKNTYQLETIYERKEILDEKEKEYLSAVIKPFRDKILSIEKSESITFKNCAYIRIRYLDKLFGEQKSSLPYFKKNTMYKGMKINKEYTLKELGL